MSDKIPVQVSSEHGYLTCPHCERPILLIQTRHLLAVPEPTIKDAK